MRPALALLVVLCAALAACGAEGESPLAVERTIPLPGVTGRIDHLAVDLGHQRLFVAEVGSGGLDVIDLRTGQRLKRAEGLKEPQGLAYLPGPNEVVVANGGDGSVRFFRADDLAPVGLVSLEGDADNVRQDRKSGLLVVADGKGLALIDPLKRQQVGEITLGDHPEGFQIDPASERAYLNIPGQRRIAVVDLLAHREVASWPAEGLIWNFPLALSTGVVATAFRAPPTLMTFDAATGRRTSRASTCGDSDDVHFDPKRRRLYVTCGSGMVETFAAGEAGYRSIGRTRTRPGARTALFVPELDRLFVAARAGDGEQAQIVVLKPQD